MILWTLFWKALQQIYQNTN